MRSEIQFERFPERLATELLPYGQAAVQYLSVPGPRMHVEHQPDLIFVPQSGRYRERLHIVDFRQVASGRVPDALLLTLLKQMAEQWRANEGTARFAVAFNVPLSTRQHELFERLSKGGKLAVMDNVRTLEDASRSILRWAGVERSR